MGWGRVPLFVWTILIYSYLVVLRSRRWPPRHDAAPRPELRDRVLRSRRGRLGAAVAAPVLVLRPPEVYIFVLPAFGVVSEIIPVFARKPIFGYKAIAASTAGIAFLGLLVWAHHMFTVPTSTVVLSFFMLASFLVAIPPG
jgi:cytochrome c oxidase subunit 1